MESQISPNVASIRDYVSGDSLKHIHWQSTAHSSKLMVKVFDPDRSRSSAKMIWVVLDMDQDSQTGTAEVSTEEQSIVIAASLLKKYIDSGWPVGLMAAAEHPYVFPPEAGSQHLESMIAALAMMQAKGKTPIEQLIANEAAHFDIDTMLVVITPSWNEKLITPLLQAKGQQGVLVAILIDPHSFNKEIQVTNLPRNLALHGIQVYIVKNEDNLGSVLDSRRLSTNAIA